MLSRRLVIVVATSPLTFYGRERGYCGHPDTSAMVGDPMPLYIHTIHASTHPTIPHMLLNLKLMGCLSTSCLNWQKSECLCLPLHSGATPLQRGFSRKNICCQKIFGNSFSFQATEMVLTSKWGRIQQEIQIWPDQVVEASWRLVRSPKHAEKMLIQLITPTEPSWPAVHSYNNLASQTETFSYNLQAGKISWKNAILVNRQLIVR